MLHAQHLVEAADQQTRTHEQHQGQRHFQRHQGPAHPPGTPVARHAALPFTQCRREVPHRNPQHRDESGQDTRQKPGPNCRKQDPEVDARVRHPRDIAGVEQPEVAQHAERQRDPEYRTESAKHQRFHGRQLHDTPPPRT